MTLEKIVELFKKYGIKTEYINHDGYNYSRTISFRVYDIDYRIVWFCNESSLHIGEGKRAACIPFKYCYYDTTFPIVGGNRSIGFSYKKEENNPIRSFPYEVFRIPIELPGG